MVIGGLWTALNHPVWFLLALLVFIVLMIWLLPKIWRGLKAVFRAIGRLFGRKDEPVAEDNALPPQS
jgi:lauroyl/myristoyl acyltransferase